MSARSWVSAGSRLCIDGVRGYAYSFGSVVV
jgi:hypothetical protein